jgi:hypothetical protein
MDEVEREYEQAIMREGADPDRAMELAIGLREYREIYKVPAPQAGEEGT